MALVMHTHFMGIQPSVHFHNSQFLAIMTFTLPQETTYIKRSKKWAVFIRGPCNLVPSQIPMKWTFIHSNFKWEDWKSTIDEQSVRFLIFFILSWLLIYILTIFFLVLYIVSKLEFPVKCFYLFILRLLLLIINIL